MSGRECESHRGRLDGDSANLTQLGAHCSAHAICRGHSVITVEYEGAQRPSRRLAVDDAVARVGDHPCSASHRVAVFDDSDLDVIARVRFCGWGGDGRGCSKNTNEKVSSSHHRSMP